MISVIGGGPVGSYTAYLLAKAGKDVSVFEARSKIGSPVQCTGIVTRAINDIVKVPESVVVNRMKSVRVVGPSSELVVKNDDIVIDRCRFDNWLKSKAEDAGAEVKLKSKFLDYGKGKVKINNKNVGTDVLVGADGPASSVAKHVTDYRRQYYVGAQARVRMKVDPSEYVVYLGDGVSPDFFGWVVPESSKVARVGIASEQNTNILFGKFLKNFKISKVIEKQGGLIPIFDPKFPIQKDNVCLVGDAAGQVKATTGGGLVPGLRCAEGLAESLLSGKSYRRSVSKVYRGLKFDLRIRKALNRFSDEDYDELIENIDGSVLSKYSRDEIVKLGVGLLFKRPKLALYGLKVLRE